MTDNLPVATPALPQFVADATTAGQRLDVFLTSALEQLQPGEFSRAGVQKLIRDGHVRRNGEQLEANPARKVRMPETYTVDLPAVVASQLIPEDIPLEVVFEDDDLLVINKPAGLTVHPAPGNYTGTLVQALLHHCGASLSGINGEARPGIVHRLDKDTSGLLVVAKHDTAHRGLARQFAGHYIHRVYHALCHGTPVPLSGVIEGNIGRHPVNRMRRAVVTEGGKPALTHYRVMERLGTAKEAGLSRTQGACLLELQLETGRTHQIRVHMSHLGYPLLNDPLYGNPRHMQGLTSALPGQALHAAELGFIHPRTRKELQFAVAAPMAFETLLTELRQQ